MAHRIYDQNIVRERLKLLRKQKGLSQKELADKIHFSESTIKQYECKNNRIPQECNVDALASFFHVSPGYILGKTDYENIIAEWAHTFSKEDLLASQAEIDLVEHIAYIGQKMFGIDYSDSYEFQKFYAYIKLFPDFLEEFAEYQNQKEQKITD